MIFPASAERHTAGHRMLVAALALLSPGAAGCFREASFDLKPGDVRQIAPVTIQSQHLTTTRDWLAGAQFQLDPLLPRESAAPLLSADLERPDGTPTDVYDHFGVNPHTLRSLFGNFAGLLLTAQVCSTKVSDQAPAPWPGFKTIWVPVDAGLSLCGRLGMACDGDRVRDADCIVILTGFLGDNSGLRVRNAAEGLLKSGYHVLSLELRGHGQTAVRYPNANYNYGVREMVDLLLVSEWLERQPHITRTGLLGFCWGGNLALLTAWLDGCLTHDPDPMPAFVREHRSVASNRHFSAGVLAICPALTWESLMDELDTPHGILSDPVLNALQDAIHRRMEHMHSPHPSGSLRQLILTELANTGLTNAQTFRSGLRLIRLMDRSGQSAGRKMDSVRIPVLIVQSANDPLSPAQDVADLIAQTANPGVAALILPNGGHTGFAAYARSYYYSLMAAYFDPVSGAAASTQRSRGSIFVSRHSPHDATQDPH